MDDGSTISYDGFHDCLPGGALAQAGESGQEARSGSGLGRWHLMLTSSPPRLRLQPWSRALSRRVCARSVIRQSWAWPGWRWPTTMATICSPVHVGAVAGLPAVRHGQPVSAGGNVLIAPGAFSLFRAQLMRDTQGHIQGRRSAACRWCSAMTRCSRCSLSWQARSCSSSRRCPSRPTRRRLSHHLRQWTRWMRASTIRQIWRLRYLPLRSYGWWYSVWQLGAFTAGVAATVVIIAAWPPQSRWLLVRARGLLVWPLILGARLFSPAPQRPVRGVSAGLYRPHAGSSIVVPAGAAADQVLRDSHLQ